MDMEPDVGIGPGFGYPVVCFERGPCPGLVGECVLFWMVILGWCLLFLGEQDKHTNLRKTPVFEKDFSMGQGDVSEPPQRSILRMDEIQQFGMGETCSIRHHQLVRVFVHPRYFPVFTGRLSMKQSLNICFLV